MTDASEWLISTAKRNPEALLVLAAGCALLMRGGGRFSAPAQTRRDDPSAPSDSPWGVSRATEKVSEVATDLKERIAGASSLVTEQAGGIAKTLSTQTSQMASKTQSMVSSGFGQLLRDQPLALIAAGLAAGAAVAALLPATEIEERTLGSARDAISGMSGRLGENIVAAASDAGERLTHEVADRAEGLKDLAKEVAGQFTNTVVGTTANKAEAPGHLSAFPTRGT